MRIANKQNMKKNKILLKTISKLELYVCFINFNKLIRIIVLKGFENFS